MTPFGIYLPQQGELYLYFTQSKVTSDFMLDCLCELWTTLRQRFPRVRTLVINQDNGPETHTRRTQFMHLLTQFVDTFHLAVQLACYPPYHSKYDPRPMGARRVWDFLEKHWNGSLLDSLDTLLKFAHSFTFRTQTPIVQLVTRLYHTGVKLTQKQMDWLVLQPHFAKESR